MNFYRADNVTDLFLSSLEDLLRSKNKPTPRGRGVRELHPVFMTLTDPRARVLQAQKRGNNPFAMMAETLWILAGRNDIEYLSYWLPRAKDFSDDGLTWRGGYGPRLRNYGCYQPYKHFEPTSKLVGVYEPGGTDSVGIDQIQSVIEILSKDPDSRRAAISIYDPSIDMVDSKDVPCSNYGVFLLRDGKLDLTLVMRSNDVLWGFSYINVFEWTVIQEIVADQLGVELGEYYHVVNSFHLYEDYVGKATEIVEANREPSEECNFWKDSHWTLPHGLNNVMPLEKIYSEVSTFLGLEEDLRSSFELNAESMTRFIMGNERIQCIKFVEWYELIFSWHIYKNLGFSVYDSYMRTLPKTSLWVACYDYVFDKESKDHAAT